MEKASTNEELSACVYWGHSWNVGLYLKNENGFYIDSYPYGGGSSQKRLSDLNASDIKLKPHTLFIFASCGTAREWNSNTFGDSSFAATFADFIDYTKNHLLKDGLTKYKITVIGATALSNLLQDGTVRTDGSFYRIEKTFEIEKKAVYKEVEEGMWCKETKKVLDRCDVSTTLIDSKLTKLGKVIDPAEIIKKHNPDETNI